MTTTTARKGGTPDAETWGRLVEMLMADPGDRHHRRAQLASAVELIGAAMAMAGREPDWIEKRVAEFADRFAKAAEGESIQVAADWVHKMAGGRELRDDSGPGLCEDGRSVMWYVQFGDDEWMGVCADSPRQINPDDFDPDAWRIRFVYALLGSYLREKLELPAASAPRGAQ